MNRRDTVLGMLALGAAPLCAHAQQSARVPRIGFVTNKLDVHYQDGFLEGLREYGWIEGKNIIVEYRETGGRPERPSEIARELVDLKVDCIVASGNPTIAALKRATSSIPIVIAYGADPVGSGFAASLAHPGGNITGFTALSEVISGKRLDILHALNPALSRVGVLVNPTIAANLVQWQQTQSVAQALGLQLVRSDFRSAEDLEPAFEAIAKVRVEAVIVLPEPIGFNQRRRIAELAAKHRLVGMYGFSELVEAGGLISYAASANELFRSSARYVDKILRGAKPGDLPIEQPTKFELVINLKTAKALGIKIPQSVLIRADRVIE